MKIDRGRLFKDLLFEYEKFHRKTVVNKKVKPGNPKYWPKSWKKIYYKSYPRLENIKLPNPKLPLNNYKTILFNRRSSRMFSKEPIGMHKISSLLYYSAGLKSNNFQQVNGNRFYPSGGGRYPLEVYFLSLNTELPKGLYHYQLKSHSLEKILDIESLEINKYFIYDWVSKSSAIILITSIFDRSNIKYKERAYPYTLIETGLLTELFYLNAAALNLNLCALAGFIEPKFNELLDIDGVAETLLLTMALGEEG